MIREKKNRMTRVAGKARVAIKMGRTTESTTVVCDGSSAEAKRKVSVIARGVHPPSSTWLSTCVSSSHVNGAGAVTDIVTLVRGSGLMPVVYW